jgi:hypothetical protein
VLLGGGDPGVAQRATGAAAVARWVLGGRMRPGGAEPCDSRGGATLIWNMDCGRAGGVADQRAAGVAATTLISMGGCITSALTGASAVEVVGSVLGTVF